MMRKQMRSQEKARHHPAQPGTCRICGCTEYKRCRYLPSCCKNLAALRIRLNTHPLAAAVTLPFSTGFGSAYSSPDSKMQVLELPESCCLPSGCSHAVANFLDKASTSVAA